MPVVVVTVASTLIAVPTLVNLAQRLNPFLLAVCVSTPPLLVTVPPNATGTLAPKTPVNWMSSSHAVPYPLEMYAFRYPSTVSGRVVIPRLYVVQPLVPAWL